MPELIERIDQITKGIETIEQILPFLPPDVREKYRELADRLRAGRREVEELMGSGRVAEAVAAANDVWDLFREKNPPREIIERALDTFGPILTTIVPPLAVVENVARLAVGLGGRAYDLWKARVLRVPFAPAAARLAVQDANTGFTILMKSPVFRKIFEAELTGNDRRFFRKTVHRYVEKGDVDWIWPAYRDRFESAEQFQEAAAEFEAAAANVVMTQLDAELRDVVESTSADSTVDYDTLVAAIDHLRQSEDATAALHALFTVFEGLQRSGGQASSVLNKVKEEVGA